MDEFERGKEEKKNPKKKSKGGMPPGAMELFVKKAPPKDVGIRRDVESKDKDDERDTCVGSRR